MFKRLLFFFIFSTSFVSAQIDYSDSWEDFFSYNNVKDFVKVDNMLYALSDNAIFTYDDTTQEIEKLSSVQGLSGETTSAIHYSIEANRLVIGYENGLIEVVDSDGSITISTDIVSFNQTGEKSINDIFEYQGKLYLSTSFAIVEYDITELEFGDTFFIGNNSTDVNIHQITVFNDRIFAATENGVFYADSANPNLIDFNNWNTITSANNNFKNITVFNNKLYTILNTQLYEVNEMNELEFIKDFFLTVSDLKGSLTNLSVAFDSSVIVYDTQLTQIFQASANSDFEYTLNTAFAENNQLLLATKQFGILSSTFLQDAVFLEIHPEGPVSNDVFSVSAQSNELWALYMVVLDLHMAPIQRKLGFTHFMMENHWFTAEGNDSFKFFSRI